jgi:hypothetical protein
MTAFIELTLPSGELFFGNLDRLTLVCLSVDKSAVIVQFDGVDPIKVKETYEEVIERIKTRVWGVNRAHW